MAEDYSDSRMSMFHANEMHCICVHLFICLLAHRIVRRAVHSGQLAWQSSVADIVQGIECRRHRTVARSYARMSAHCMASKATFAHLCLCFLKYNSGYISSSRPQSSEVHAPNVSRMLQRHRPCADRSTRSYRFSVVVIEQVVQRMCDSS